MVTTGWSMSTEGKTLRSVCGSVWYIVRNVRCTATIDSVLANCKTQNAFLSPVHAMFRHDCPLAVKPAGTPRRLLPPPPTPPKKIGEVLYLLICFFMLCLSWLLRCHFRSSGGTYELPCIDSNLNWSLLFIVNYACTGI
jgi:hypothetical protein